MKSFSVIFSIVLASIFALNFYTALGQVAIVSNPKYNHKYGGDMILFGNGGGCPPGFIKDGGRKGTSVIAVPSCKPIKKEKKVEFVPFPVKEYVPIPMKMSHGMDMDDMGWGMDTKKSVTHTSADKKGSKTSKNDNKNRERSESRMRRVEKPSNRPQN